MSLRTFSYGGGVQSTAALVLAAQGRIDYRTFLFANTGDDSENPATLDYVRRIATPYAEVHGIEIVELQRHLRSGEVETLFGRLTREDRKSIPIPMHFSSNKPMTRACTADFKVRLLARWLRQHGATPEDPATVALGISVDEIERAKPGLDTRNPEQVRTYPLLDLDYTRADCAGIIGRAGLPVPEKSACWFCPFHSLNGWRDILRRQPELFAKAVALEKYIGERREAQGLDPVWLTNRPMPLDQAVTDNGQLTLDLEGSGCESGYCMT